MRFPFLFSLLFSCLLLGACSAPAPTETKATPNPTQTSTPQTVQVQQVNDTIATLVAATLTAQAVGTQQSSFALAGIVETRVAGTLTAISPSNTSTPPPSPTLPAPTETETATPTTSSTSTSIPLPTSTSPPVAPPLPLPPTSSIKYPAPYTARPAKWSVLVGQDTDITFAWRSNVLLAQDERFIVYTRFTYDYDREPWSGWCITAWTQDTQWTSTGDWRHIAPGCFGQTIKGVQKVIQWMAIIQRYANGQVLGDLSPESEPSEFIWKPI